MMDPSTGLSRGFCFVTFCEKGGAEEAVKQVSCVLYIFSVCLYHFSL